MANRPTGVKCPRCKVDEVVYNGNYFCVDEEECGWVMPEGFDVKPFLTGLRDKAAERGDTGYVERCNFYLERLNAY